MRNIVFINEKKLHLQTMSETGNMVQLNNQMTVVNETYVVDGLNIDAYLLKSKDVFVSSKALQGLKVAEGLNVYFDLEQYPFFQKLKEMLANQQKGIFRFKRKANKNEGVHLLIGDLYVLASLLGEPKDIQVKRTNSAVTPYHVIVTISFKGGSMAHVECTFTTDDREFIEFEWNGIKTIIEFNSIEMTTNLETSLPQYNLSAILASAHKVDQKLMNRLEYFSRVIIGREQS
ncbi:hypothetical protein [Alkalihalobacillus sp. 1P02AB]|uniref:hypothetical protein n=1 Tax=Alkalihalobacillus sp. 1P02AB TaxID=3132260 RepID=UPI0039A6F7A2